MGDKAVIGNNDIDDARWLCSLSDSELDLLVGLKTMVKMRAKQIGREALAKKFDLRMLRSLSLIFMEHLKGQLKDVPASSGLECNLLKRSVDDSFSRMTIEDLDQYICTDKRKRIADKLTLPNITWFAALIAMAGYPNKYGLIIVLRFFGDIRRSRKQKQAPKKTQNELILYTHLQLKSSN